PRSPLALTAGPVAALAAGRPARPDCAPCAASSACAVRGSPAGRPRPRGRSRARSHGCARAAAPVRRPPPPATSCSPARCSARPAITDRGGRQPLARRGSRLCGVLNGAITDARLRWQQWHPGLGACPRLPNDAWLPLLLVERGAPAALAALAGHHALAVVDGGRDALVLARDAMGEKPLWVARAGGRGGAFAATLPALAALGGAAELPAAAVAEFFARGSAGSAVAADPDLTLHDDLAGVDDGERLVPPAALLGAAHASAGDLAAALTAATARCADAAEPLALCLSGGLDSSCLAAVLGELGRKVRGYQFRAAGDPGDERAAAAAVAAHTGLALRPVDGGPEVLDPLPRLTAHWGLPLGDPSVLALHALANAAAADGVRVLLSGEGSDEAPLG